MTAQKNVQNRKIHTLYGYDRDISAFTHGLRRATLGDNSSGVIQIYRTSVEEISQAAREAVDKWI
jgi:hypothetical protein